MKEADFKQTIAMAVAPLQASGGAAPRGGGLPFGGPMAFGQSNEVDGVVIQAKVASDISLTAVVLCKDATTAAATKKKLDAELPKLKSNPMVPADLKSALDVKSSVSGRKLTVTTDIKVAPLIKAVKGLGPLMGGMGGMGGK
jgi:hypothetical protein